MIEASYKQYINIGNAVNVKHPALVRSGKSILLTLPKQHPEIKYNNYWEYEVDAIVLLGDNQFKEGSLIRKLNLEVCSPLEKGEEVIIKNKL